MVQAIVNKLHNTMTKINMGWDGMGWDGMDGWMDGWDGMGWDVMDGWIW